jgi:hypothetical protein
LAGTCECGNEYGHTVVPPYLLIWYPGFQLYAVYDSLKKKIGKIKEINGL